MGPVIAMMGFAMARRKARANALKARPTSGKRGIIKEFGAE